MAYLRVDSGRKITGRQQHGQEVDPIDRLSQRSGLDPRQPDLKTLHQIAELFDVYLDPPYRLKRSGGGTPDSRENRAQDTADKKPEDKEENSRPLKSAIYGCTDVRRDLTH